jgi:hypothetical protein
MQSFAQSNATNSFRVGMWIEIKGNFASGRRIPPSFLAKNERMAAIKKKVQTTKEKSRQNPNKKTKIELNIKVNKNNTTKKFLTLV